LGGGALMDQELEISDRAQGTKSLDDRYVPFPPFNKWAELYPHSAAWEDILRIAPNAADLSPDILRKARGVATRAAAIDTGAIEDLYDVNAGFTISIATEVGAWESAFAEHGKRRSLIESQLEAYDYVLDFATHKAPIAAVWIRELHVILCKSQETYTVVTAAGPQQHQLAVGKYKETPNHVISRGGGIHAYTPVLEVEREMQRFIDELSTVQFQSAHPFIQAAYSHYAFVTIHPFSDGNGRVARALASVFLYRAASLPLMVLMEHRDMYFAALEAADSADYNPIIQFVAARTVDAANLVAESIRTAQLPDPKESAANINRLYRTRGGYEYSVLDSAGTALLQEIEREIVKRLSETFASMSVSVHAAHENSLMDPPKGMRNLIGTNQRCLAIISSMPPPANADYATRFYVWLPIDPVESDPVIVRSSASSVDFELPIRDVLPRITTVAKFKIAMYTEGIAGQVAFQLQAQGRESLSKSGFVPSDYVVE
jgi:prophage maintenance system killer protein